jgi:hypothetical protein
MKPPSPDTIAPGVGGAMGGPQGAQTAPAITPSQPPTPGPDLVAQQMAKLDKLEAQIGNPATSFLDNRSPAEKQLMSPADQAEARAAIQGLRDLTKRYGGDFNAPGVPADVRKQAAEFVSRLRQRQPRRMTAAEGERATGGMYFGGKQ